jgi:hypothetical protein
MKKLLITLICVSMVLMSGIAVAGDVINNAPVGEQANATAGALIDKSGQDNSVTNRNFVNAGNTPIPGTNGFFTNPTPDSSFRSIKDIFNAFMGPDKYCIIVSEGALQSMARGGDVTSHLQILRGHNQITRIYDDDSEGIKVLYIAVEEPVFAMVNGKRVLTGTKRIEDLAVTGLIDGEADDANTNSIQVIGKTGLKALKDGNNYMVITAEGAHRMVEASGWGVGLYSVGGTVSESGKQSGLVGGGTGFAKNKTGTEDQPWIQGYVGVKEMDNSF